MYVPRTLLSSLFMYVPAYTSFTTLQSTTEWNDARREHDVFLQNHPEPLFSSLHLPLSIISTPLLPFPRSTTPFSSIESIPECPPTIPTPAYCTLHTEYISS
ncbi:hypothetical protein B5807_08750 [Epicoccum nigrum]|uniref:Uncharacterized protein n=1 Tax=Epicoccum nigrum TaxID=105696 RepID=A0A1Y2LSR9_EPING|nr:hypothetical protein B5807_08750 [Epicoccum nigrum]